MSKCYSTDGEMYDMSEICEVVDRLSCNDELKVGRIYHEADVEKLRHTHIFTAMQITDILEYVDDSVAELVGGEYYIDHFSTASDQAKAELTIMLAAWTEKHVNIHKYCIVKNSVRKFITEQDIHAQKEIVCYNLLSRTK